MNIKKKVSLRRAIKNFEALALSKCLLTILDRLVVQGDLPLLVIVEFNCSELIFACRGQNSDLSELAGLVDVIVYLAVLAGVQSFDWFGEWCIHLFVQRWFGVFWFLSSVTLVFAL